MKIARSILRQGNVELLRDIEKVKAIVDKLAKKHDVSSEQVFRLIKGEAIIPASIFNKKLTILEAVVRYLKENLDYNYHEISELIARNERNIWHIHNSAKKKHPAKIIVRETEYFIPVSVFADKKLSAFEAVVLYLRNVYKLSYHEIAAELKRDERNIWTICNRAISKVK